LKRRTRTHGTKDDDIESKVESVTSAADKSSVPAVYISQAMNGSELGCTILTQEQGKGCRGKGGTQGLLCITKCNHRAALNQCEDTRLTTSMCYNVCSFRDGRVIDVRSSSNPQ
jgi:hypothetical protein